MQGYLTIFALIFLGFIFFSIYYCFKQMQFVIQAVNLYKDMVTRQDATIKLLKDIRDIQSGNSSTTSNEKISFTDDIKVSNSIATEEEQLSPQQSQELYNNGKCPKCKNDIQENAVRCPGCQENLISFAQEAYKSKK